jgi:hypothetical protein
MGAKLSPKLREIIGNLPDPANIDLVLELVSPQGPKLSLRREERIKQAKASYEKLALPIRDIVQRLGGQTSGGSWVDSTIRATVPKHAIEELSQERDILQIDDGSPRALTPE